MFLYVMRQQDNQCLFDLEENRKPRGAPSSVQGNIPSRYPDQYTNNATGYIQTEYPSRYPGGFPMTMKVRNLTKELSTDPGFVYSRRDPSGFPRDMPSGDPSVSSNHTYQVPIIKPLMDKIEIPTKDTSSVTEGLKMSKKIKIMI